MAQQRLPVVAADPHHAHRVFAWKIPLTVPVDWRVSELPMATIALALAAVQVLLALWIYRKLPLAPRPPRPVPIVYRVTGFALVALTIPVAVHCLIAYGVQLS